MPAKKRGLGRGLDSLLGPQAPASPEAPAKGTAVQNIPVVQIRPNPYQPRHHFDEEGLDDLTASIRANGILQPLILRKAGHEYEIVAGERRWRAAQRATLTEVPAIIRGYDDREMLELALIENIQREQLNAIEEARAYQQLIEEFELTQEAIAEQVGKSRVAVTNGLRLLKLPQQIQQWLEEDRISAGHARALLGLEHEASQIAVAREVMAKGLSVREAERRVRNLQRGAGKTGEQKKAGPSERPAEIVDLEERLRLELGQQVKIHPQSNESGRIEVYYSSLDEFQKFVERLGIELQQEV